MLPGQPKHSLLPLLWHVVPCTINAIATTTDALPWQPTVLSSVRCPSHYQRIAMTTNTPHFFCLFSCMLSLTLSNHCHDNRRVAMTTNATRFFCLFCWMSSLTLSTHCHDNRHVAMTTNPLASSASSVGCRPSHYQRIAMTTNVLPRQPTPLTSASSLACRPSHYQTIATTTDVSPRQPTSLTSSASSSACCPSCCRRGPSSSPWSCRVRPRRGPSSECAPPSWGCGWSRPAAQGSCSRGGAAAAPSSGCRRWWRRTAPASLSCRAGTQRRRHRLPGYWTPSQPSHPPPCSVGGGSHQCPWNNNQQLYRQSDIYIYIYITYIYIIYIVWSVY